ncbi:MAG: germination protein YpeB [Ruminiclostridium sp.]|nr:germination protein YpeB [Ruminiclostridium sp.]
MNISKRCFVRIVSFMIALILVIGIIAVQGHSSAGTLKRQLQYDMARSVQNLSESLDNISTTLTKGIYAGSPQMMSFLSAKLWSDAASAKAELSALPVASLHLENTYKFLSQVGNYSKSLSERYSEGEQISDSDRENLITLSEYAKRLCENMWIVQQKINEGRLSFENTEKNISDAEDNEEPAYITEGFTEFEEGYDNYPTLIYDGPFSDNILKKEPEMLKNTAYISEADALKKAQRASGEKELSRSEETDEQGKLPCYVFTKGDTTVAVTKQGGLLCYTSDYREVTERRLTGEEAVEKAEEYLSYLGIDDMSYTYYEVSRNVCTINFAAEEEDILIYTDLVKVSVALDNGEIIGFDGRGYITNHKEREIKTPKLAPSQAAEKISPYLTVTGKRLCYIPSRGADELYCYEFRCYSKDENGGTPILVYINADSGKEEQILLLEISENGTLAV